MTTRAAWALVTGASAGIGAEIARSLARRRYNVVLTARREARLESLGEALEREHAVKTRVVAADLGDAGSRGALLEALGGLPIGFLANNAGYGLRGGIDALGTDAQVEMVRVNCEAVVGLTAPLVARMKDRGEGRVLTVASIAAFQAGPWMAAYYATKGFDLLWSEALWHELRGTGVTATALCPGPTRSEFFERASMGGTAVERLAGGVLAASAAGVAEAGVAGAMRGRRVVVPGLMNKASVLSTRVLPRRWAAGVAGRMQR